MVYTVKELAKLSGVSVRTLHWYDEIELLKPSTKGVNNYRYYEKDQLLRLQQILFFKELGFALNDIQKLLLQDDFNNIKTLKAHRIILEEELARKNHLINTIDKTIQHLEGKQLMKDEELYYGFDSERQKEYEDYLINSFGEKVGNVISNTKTEMKNWSKSQWNHFHEGWDSICSDLADSLKNNMTPDSPEVQKIIARHHQWLPWGEHEHCTKEAYIGLGQGYTGFEWKKAFMKYDGNHPCLANFMAKAMEYYANKNL